MHIDKKMMHRLFLLVAGSIVFAWLVLDTARATELFTKIWELIAPFVTGAAIAFIFNVPMRSIENQLEGIRKRSIRRVFSILLTIAAFALVITFVVELLVPQIRLTVQSLSQQIPAFVENTAAKIVVFMDENPEIKAFVLESLNLESIEWSSVLKEMLTVVSDSISSVMGGAVNVIGNLTGIIVNAVISIVFAIYCLSRKEILARQGRRILYSFLSEHRADEVIRIFRLFQINAYYDSLNVIAEVISSKRQQLLSSVFTIALLMLASSLCMYSLEHEAQPQVFSNAFSGMWWSVSTLLTVGYGDIYPVTTLGKIFSIFITFLGGGMVAIPTGIISAGFVDQYSRLKKLSEYANEEDVHFIKVLAHSGDFYNEMADKLAKKAVGING